jgi:hypothetical protein
MERLQRIMIGNGLLVVLASMLAGFMLMLGLLLMVIALALPKLNLSANMQRFVAYGFIYVAWSFTVFYWLGNAAENRALTFGDNPLGQSDIFGILGFLPGLPSVFLVVILLAITAKGIFSKND